MIRLVAYAFLSALLGASIVYLLADGLPEGAVAGAVIGASIGVMVAVRKGAGDSSTSFEYEAAGIHDGNLTTTARRNLVREAYRTDANQPPPEFADDAEHGTPQDRRELTQHEQQAR